MSFNRWTPLALATIGATLAMAVARAEDDPWEVRLRAVYLDPANKSDAIAGLAPANAIHINSKVLPDLDFEHFFTPNWSAELVLTYPQSQTVSVSGTDIGTFKHLPPVLTAKYNFLPQQDFQPYVGAGVNLTLISNVNLAVPGVGKLDLSSSSVGPALQAGFDYRVAEHWFLNADVKWFKLGSDVDLVGVGKISTVHIDPFLFGVGIGYRFGGHEALAPEVPVAAAPPAPPPPPPPPPPAVAPAPAPVAAAAPPKDSDNDGVPDYLDKCPGTPPGVKVDANGCEIDEVVLRGVTFNTDSAVLSAQSSEVLDGVVATLRQRPDATAEVRGYTDATGKPAHNLSLSQHRAQAVVDYLVAHGIPSAHLNAKGLGADDPVASNATAAGRAENRRVTIKFSQPVPR
jgi:outer membrane protein